MKLALQDRIDENLKDLPMTNLEEASERETENVHPSIKYRQSSRECATMPRSNPYCWINEKGACDYQGKLNSSNKKYKCSNAGILVHATSSLIN